MTRHSWRVEKVSAQQGRLKRQVEGQSKNYRGREKWYKTTWLLNRLREQGSKGQNFPLVIFFHPWFICLSLFSVSTLVFLSFYFQCMLLSVSPLVAVCHLLSSCFPLPISPSLLYYTSFSKTSCPLLSRAVKRPQHLPPPSFKVSSSSEFVKCPSMQPGPGCLTLLMSWTWL